jgi:hypothetical protein
MFRGSVPLAILVALVTTVAGGRISRANPLASLIPFQKIDADPNESYELTEENGPWLIMATSFAREGAYEEAHQLVLELRRRFKMNAYIFKKRFDFTDRELPGIGVTPRGEPVKMRYYKEESFDEFAVMVGDFEAVDDPKLQKTLEKIKHVEPECLDLRNRESTTRRFALLREYQRWRTTDRDIKSKGPMRHAIAAPNPLLPAEYFAPRGLDKLVEGMNQDVEYSLLECPGRYSVRVATFRGHVILDQKKIREIENGAKFEFKLDEAAWKAHRLTQLLRKQGWEAYEFHDRQESIVTVGSFNSIGAPQLDGRTELNPAVHGIMTAFGPKQVAGSLGGVQQVGLQPKGLEGIPFDVQPVPVEVPRRSIATDYARAPSGW